MISSILAQTDLAARLLGEGTINSVTLAQARRESETFGLPLVDVLLAHDWISDAAIAQAYNTTCNYAVTVPSQPDLIFANGFQQ